MKNLLPVLPWLLIMVAASSGCDNSGTTGTGETGRDGGQTTSSSPDANTAARTCDTAYFTNKDGTFKMQAYINRKDSGDYGIETIILAPVTGKLTLVSKERHAFPDEQQEIIRGREIVYKLEDPGSEPDDLEDVQEFNVQANDSLEEEIISIRLDTKDMSKKHPDIDLPRNPKVILIRHDGSPRLIGAEK